MTSSCLLAPQTQGTGLSCPPSLPEGRSCSLADCTEPRLSAGPPHPRLRGARGTRSGPVQLQRCDHPEDRAAGLLETEAAPQGAGPRAQAPRAGGLQACPPPGPLQVRSPGASAPGEKGRAAGDPGGLQLPWLRPVQLSYHPSDRPWGCLPRRPSQLLQAGPRIWAQ